MSGLGLRCPECGSIRLCVKDSRPRENFIVRRRHCKACGACFKSYEYSEADLPSMEREPREALKAVQAMAERMIVRVNQALRDE